MRHLLNTPNLPRFARIEAGAECLMAVFADGFALDECLKTTDYDFSLDRKAVAEMFEEEGAADYILDDAEWGEVLALCAKKLQQETDE